MKKYLSSYTYFRLAFILYIFINTLALGYLGISNTFLSVIIIIWGIYLIINGIFQKQINMNKNFIYIGMYGIILLLATILNQKYSDLKSYILAIVQIIIFCLLFNNQKSITITSIKKEISLIIPFTNILVGFASLISIIMYFFNIYDSKNGWIIGVPGNRLFGIYFNCNPASFLACITILLAILAIIYNYRYKKLYYANISIQVIYILLTKCRSALIILALIATALIYYFFLKEKQYPRLKKISVICILCITIIFGSLVINKGINTIFNQEEIQEESRFQISKVIEATYSLFTGDSSKALELIDQVSSGRLELLTTSFEIWLKSPVIGIGANNFKKMGMDQTNGITVQSIQVVHSHNEFVEALVTTGFIGLILFGLFFLTSFKKIIYLLNNCNDKHYFSLLIFSLIVVCEVIGGLFDYGVFYNYSLSTAIAWIFLGYLNLFYDKTANHQ
ncbi:MAG: O-antigen ligase family protein [[Clostridium] spiroforme]|uniref:O-antigen ligase family protein n=1 Tax=Thomasclavelia spiroformis TaxID=29348 RepID=A0A943I6Q0_9FIRM|nr:O-antigen ligase family protein [Thomasclavelia spiroformis]MBS5588760.1 O-antigen ligase family protein [Thomasclavelia spiroformis]